jgi:dTDP-4-dehydrorhamnose reductase
MKILITGASGFIGGHLLLGLSKAGHEAVAVCGANKVATEVAACAASVECCDLRDETAVRALTAKVRPEAIVHAAALCNTGVCQKDPAKARAVNAGGTDNLCAAALASGGGSAPLFIYFSTDLVFDGKRAPEGGFSETDSPKPLSTYARSKFEGEEFVRRYGGRSVVLRTALSYGGRIASSEGFMGWLRGGLAEGKEVSCFIDEFRTPICTDDIIAAVEAVLSCPPGALDSQSLLHLGGPERISRYEFALALAKIYGFDPLLVKGVHLDDVDTDAPRAQDASLCVSKIRKLLGFNPLDVHTGLSRLAETIKLP